MDFFEAIFVTLCAIISLSSCQDILGCGGFVKSSIEINYSLVEVKLYTKQGSLKYQMDCAPNNGYYMIPVYDKGAYVLKVEPPKGWKFEPESVALNIDGSTDQCSKGEDINFQFVGFSIEGVVISKGQSVGPEGVHLKLVKKDDESVVDKQLTQAGGGFTFEKVLPGLYELEASHPQWILEKAKVPVKVDVSNAKIHEGPIVHGYDVNGQVLSDGEPVKDVKFLIFSSKVKAQDAKGCDTTPLKGYKASGGNQPICHVQSNKDGAFTVASLPTGDYTVVPFYKGERITFDVIPAKLQFKVEHDSVHFQEPFQVAGFSVSGRVLHAKEGTGIAGAKIQVDGKEVVVSKADGSYHLENMKTGTYILKITADQIGFDDVTVKISPNTPQLQDITPSSFSMCGQIIIDKIPRGSDISTKDRTIQLASTKNAVLTTLTADEQGKFCTYVRPGTYKIKPTISDEESKAGLKLSPDEKEITVADQPLSGIVFSQFKARASGSVKCIGKCGSAMQITLVAAGKSGDHRTTKVETKESLAKFAFDELMPGRYQVTLVEDQWCWKEKSMKFEVVDRDVTGLDFVQSGFLMTYTSTHEISAKYTIKGKPTDQGTIDVSSGSGVQCLTLPGIYKLKPVSCHMFETDSYTFDTGKPSALTFTAVKHQVQGVVSTKDKCNDLVVTVKSPLSSEKPASYGPLKAEGEETLKKDKKETLKGPFTYKFEHWGRPGESLTVSLSSKELLFYPPSRDVVVLGESCPGAVVKFEGRKGVFIGGNISPALGDVQVIIIPENDPDNVITALTDKEGAYRVGPLHDHSQYSVVAEKTGYVMTPVEGKHGHFKAFKLGQISVEVLDEASKPLGSVLLSLSGSARYRSNNLTHENGSMIFSNLSPGQYFLRPMMKEYQFEPASKMIEVTEGSTVSLKVKGRRVAYSCYGSVTSLNGEPESGVIIEAVGKGDNCETHQEESKTEKDGTYRIRGLIPQCEYEIHLKSGDVNEHIERSAPKFRRVKVTNGDSGDVNIIAFRRMNQMDLSGRIVTEQNFLSSLKVMMYREDQPDSPVNFVLIGASNFFYLPSIQIDHKNYFIRLESSLSKSAYDYNLPEVTFTANASNKHFVMQFTPKLKSTEQELNHGSFLIVPLAILIVLISYNYQKIKPYLIHATGRFSNTAKKSAVQSSIPAPTLSAELIDADLPTKKKVRVRRT